MSGVWRFEAGGNCRRFGVVGAHDENGNAGAIMLKTALIAAAGLAATSFAAAAMPAAPAPAGAPPVSVQWRGEGGDTTVIRRHGPGGETTVIRRGDDRRHRHWREETGSIERCRTVVIRKMDDRGNQVTRRIRRCG
jgi:hypothetical protein